MVMITDPSEPRPVDVYTRFLTAEQNRPLDWDEVLGHDVAGAPAEVGQGIDRNLERLRTDLLELSHDIHAHPELNFEEHHAAATVAALLERHGYEVERGAWGLATAFRATVGSGGPHVAILAEYDALPSIGHGCGHNVICGIGVGGFLALAPLVEQLGGRLSLFGTPAEEGGCGKELIARAGGFDDVDAAMMVHPANDDVTEADRLGLRQVAAVFRGRTAHAAASPYLGRNALDAAVTAYQSVAQMRQHLMPTERIHGIIVDGGAKANIVPERAELSFYVRSPSVETLGEMTERLDDILRGAARATGTVVDIDLDIAPLYVPVRSNRMLASRYRHALGLRGRPVEPAGLRPGGSTDLGNVSFRVPAIHPNIRIAPIGVSAHSPGFAAAAITDEADRAVIDGSAGMASTAADFLADAALRSLVRDEFERRGGAVDVEALSRAAERGPERPKER